MDSSLQSNTTTSPITSTTTESQDQSPNTTLLSKTATQENPNSKSVSGTGSPNSAGEGGSPKHSNSSRDALIRSWEFESVSSEIRQQQRPSMDLDIERNYVTRKTRSSPSALDTSPSQVPTAAIPVYPVKPASPESYVPPVSARNGKDESLVNEMANQIFLLQNELKNLKNFHMATKWENDELKCENRRCKMVNEELKKAIRDTEQIKRHHYFLQGKYTEICGEFSKTISKLEQENKYLRSVASIQQLQIPESLPLPKVQNLIIRPKNTISNLID